MMHKYGTIARRILAWRHWGGRYCNGSQQAGRDTEYMEICMADILGGVNSLHGKIANRQDDIIPWSGRGLKLQQSL